MRPEGAPDLLVEWDGRLQLLKSNFERVHDFGLVGPVDCPIAYDAKSQTAYRYRSQSSLVKEDFSRLDAFNLETGEFYPVHQFALNQWALWLLEWIEAEAESGGQLLGLLAIDRTNGERLVIDHNLCTILPDEARLLQRPLCKDAYRPLAFSRRRREFLFSGAEGIYVVGLKGERKRSLYEEGKASGQGGAFDPSGKGRVVLGGGGLYLWDFEYNQSERLSRHGRHPVWAADGSGIWFRQSSGDLYFYDLVAEESRRILGIPRQHNPEFWYGRAPSVSRCGRYLAVSLTSKRLKGLSRKGTVSGERERVFKYDHALCVLDLEQQALWRCEGFAAQACWVSDR